MPRWINLKTKRSENMSGRFAQLPGAATLAFVVPARLGADYADGAATEMTLTGAGEVHEYPRCRAKPPLLFVKKQPKQSNSNSRAL